MSSSTGAWEPLFERFATRDATVGVVGLGYVGLPVAAAFAEAGFRVIGVDREPGRIEALVGRSSYLRDVPAERIAPLVESARLRPTGAYDELASADAILICVPTPLLEGTPDLSAIRGAGDAVGRVLSPRTLVVLESTTYPGTTEEVLVPLLETGGLRVEQDFLVAFSPERIDPGNPAYSFEDIPKIVGGGSPDATRAAELLYSQVVPKVVTVPGTREAEMAKLIENTFRHVNIALVNELAVYAHDLGIDIWEAIGAAATKPFGYMPFWPGPGWGGHCIPLDPSYLSWRVRKDRAHEVRFVELAHTINAEMPRYVAERIGLLLNDQGKPVRGARILGIGVAYKGGTEDRRGSPGVKVLEKLIERGAEVAYHDPLIPEVEIGAVTKTSVDLSPETLAAQDLVVVLARQDEVAWDVVERSQAVVLDCCNVFSKSARPGIMRM